MFVQIALRISLLLMLLSPALAEAAQRTFVSAGSGSDSNPCTRAFPCRGFSTAISQTDPGGEVVVLDTGGYGPVSITQSVALIAPPGVHAAITAIFGDAIDVAAGPADVVILRGLYVNGLPGMIGIKFRSGKTLIVEDCAISGFDAGLYAEVDGADVYVTDTVSRLSNYGFFFTASTAIRANLISVRAEENFYDGVVAIPNALVTVTRGVAAGNGSHGFHATEGGVINLESCTATLNGTGVAANAGTVRVRNSMITGNATGVSASNGGATISFGNNGLHGNGTDGTFSATVAQQ